MSSSWDPLITWLAEELSEPSLPISRHMIQFGFGHINTVGGREVLWISLQGDYIFWWNQMQCSETVFICLPTSSDNRFTRYYKHSWWERIRSHQLPCWFGIRVVISALISLGSINYCCSNSKLWTRFLIPLSGTGYSLSPNTFPSPFIQ